MSFSWKDEYKIGNAEIDTEHQMLFQIAEAFFEATDKASRSICAMRLYQYTREHFRHEEQVMLAVNYPKREVHVQQHNVLIHTLNGVSEKIADETLQFSELEDFLRAWLLGHMRTFDTRLAAYIRLEAFKADQRGTQFANQGLAFQ